MRMLKPVIAAVIDHIQEWRGGGDEREEVFFKQVTGYGFRVTMAVARGEAGIEFRRLADGKRDKVMTMLLCTM